MLFNFEDYGDLEERRTLLEDALADRKIHAKHPVVTSLKATPKGREVIDRATMHLKASEDAIEYRVKLKKSIDDFGEAVKGLAYSGSELDRRQAPFLLLWRHSRIRTTSCLRLQPHWIMSEFMGMSTQCFPRFTAAAAACLSFCWLLSLN